MIIPSPRLERVPYSLHGMSAWQQILHKWLHAPRYRLLEDYVITLDDGLELVHPAGFIVDGASIPRWLWPIISPTGPLLEGSVPHDMFYQHGYLLARRRDGQIYPQQSEALWRQYRCIFGNLVPLFIDRGQRFGDELLRGITVERHGATVDANRAYMALRVFGRFAWKRYRTLGPSAYNNNSLCLPGIITNGVAF